MRLIQQARKDAGLVVTDRITVIIGADGDVADAVRTHREWISTQVLATGLELAPPSPDAISGTVDESPVTIRIADVLPAR